MSLTRCDIDVLSVLTTRDGKLHPSHEIYADTFTDGGLELYLVAVVQAQVFAWYDDAQERIWY